MLLTTPASFANQTDEEIDSFQTQIYLSGIRHGHAKQASALPLTHPYIYIENGYIYHGVLNRYDAVNVGTVNYPDFQGLYRGFVYYTGNTTVMLD